MMNRQILTLFSVLCLSVTASGRTLSLDSCRAMALRSNKQMSVVRVKKEIATNTRKAARTKYLPHIDLAGGYLYSSREISLLNDQQKNVLNNMGTMLMGEMGKMTGGLGQGLSQSMQQNLMGLVQQGVLTPAEAQKFGAFAQALAGSAGAAGQALAPSFERTLNSIGEKITDAFKTNTHHIITASAMLTQPIFMGGAITAANNMADIAERMAETSITHKQNDVLYDIDNAYWTVVSLRHKQQLAEAYLQLVCKLDSDVHKMIDYGVATRADGLKVDVAVNEADMTKAKVDNGLALARMYLCQLCGLDLDADITLEDESNQNIQAELLVENDMTTSQITSQLRENRPELQLLQDAVDISKEQTKLARAAYLPQIALTGGVLFTNPSLYNSFERKFKGQFNVGVMVRVPVLDWGETMYKIRATKCSTMMAQLAYDEAQEMMQLQVSQCNFRVREANKNLETARKNIHSAEENLRCANLGFKEGVMQTTDVMAAQTAWMQAQTQKIDAEIDVKMSETALKKALGEM